MAAAPLDPAEAFAELGRTKLSEIDVDGLHPGHPRLTRCRR